VFRLFFLFPFPGLRDEHRIEEPCSDCARSSPTAAWSIRAERAAEEKKLKKFIRRLETRQQLQRVGTRPDESPHGERQFLRLFGLSRKGLVGQLKHKRHPA
jgi:hypothetical protein